MEKRNKIILISCTLILLILIPCVLATERPVRGWIKYSNNTGIYNSTVNLQVKLYAHLSQSNWCYCQAPNTTTSTSGEWVENLNNLEYSANCTITGKGVED